MKLYLSRFLACLMISISFLNIISLTSFADTRQSAKGVASKSDADFNFDISDPDTYFYSVDDVVPLADNLPSVNNTVHLNRVRARIEYYDMSNNVKSYATWLSGSGQFTIPRPSDFARLIQFRFVFEDGSIPKPGNYDFQLRFGSNVGGYSFSSCDVLFLYRQDNASNAVSTHPISDFRMMSGDIYISTSFKIASNLQPPFYFLFNSPTDFGFPFGGTVSARFSPISTEGAIVTSPVPPPSSDDIQSSINDSVSNISAGVDNINQSITSGVDSINGNLEEIIRTISMQLEAFWQQLYIGIFQPDQQNRNENTQKVVNAIDTLDSDVLDGFESLQDNDNSNTNSINNNITNNFDNLENGYDNSSINSDNDRLSGKLDEYEQLEDELLSDTKDNLNNFKFENPFTSFNAVMSDISYILTSIYNGLGSFNIPIAFSMTLTIAMLCIGWYRFKGGT